MANLAQITNYKAEYSENILPITALLSDDTTLNYSGDLVTLSNNYSFEGSKSIRCSKVMTITNYVSTFDLGSALTTTLDKDGFYLFSFRVLDNTSYFTTFPIDIRLKVYINSVLSYTFSNIFENGTSENEQWYGFAQNIALAGGDIVDFAFEIDAPYPGTPNPTLDMYIGGFKLELDDRFLGIPSVYSKPKSEQITGYQSRVDTINTQILTALTENLIYFSGTLEENGGLTLMNANAKVTPISLNDIISVDFAFTSINPVGTDQYINCNFVVDGVVYRSQTFPLVKGAGFEDNCSVSFVFPVTATFLTNGGEFYLYPSSATTIKNRYLAVTRIGKGK